MALDKNSININFSNGVDTKTDPFQVQVGKFLSLQNTVFDKGGRLSKRNGYKALATLPTNDSIFAATYKGGLVALGESLYSYNSDIAKWVDKGNLHPVTLSTVSAIRSDTTQIQADTAVAANGLACVAYTDSQPQGTFYKYAIFDSVNNQMIVNPTIIDPTASGSPRVFILNNYFVIVYTANVTLNYISIPITNPTGPHLAGQITGSYLPSQRLNWDGAIYAGKLYVSYFTTAGGNAVDLVYLDNSFNVIGPGSFPLTNPTSLVTLAVDEVTARLWVTYYDPTAAKISTISFSSNLTPEGFAHQLTTDTPVINLTTYANNGIVYVYSEIQNTYPYDSSILTNYIEKTSFNSSTIAQTTTVLSRSVGLASKVFLIDGSQYVLGAYNSAYQDSYYLFNCDTSMIAGKLAYPNGGGYLAYGLPNVSIQGTMAYIPYLFKDTLQATNKTLTAVTNDTTQGIYTQTGINLATFNFNSGKEIGVSEIGQDLNISGGFISSYDGVGITEQGFFLYPDYVEAIWNGSDTHSFSGNLVTGSNLITNVSTFNGLTQGMALSGTGIPTGAIILALQVATNTIVMNLPATSTQTPSTITAQGSIEAQPQGSSTNTNAYSYQVTYEWTDNQGNLFRSAPSVPIFVTTAGTATNGTITLNIPTLRLTYKIKNPVKIVIYRWSLFNQVFTQTTLIQYPVLNNTNIDWIQYKDALSDAQILGNNILYTTGGVLEDSAPPAAKIMTLFDNRLWLVDAEDTNLLWFSKQVIESTPVEMSQLLTLYVAPTTASEGSTGPITAIAPMDDKLIIFKENALGYINGKGPDNTGANSSYSDFILINSVVGCTNQNSIVFTPNGLMFQSNKGIWLLGRDLSTTYIGAPVESFTTNTAVNSAINVPTTNQVRFTLDSGITLMYDYYYAQWGTFANIPAVSSTIFQNLHTYINSLGQVLQETPGVYLDNTRPVLMSFTTSWINLAGLQGFERFSQMYLLGQYFSPFKLQMQLAYNYNPSQIQTSFITPEQSPDFWGNQPLWGSNYWGGNSTTGGEKAGNVFEARLFPQIQKCESFQITMNEVFDPSFGTAPGAGLTLSGLNLITAMKRGFRTSKASRNFG